MQQAQACGHLQALPLSDGKFDIHGNKNPDKTEEYDDFKDKLDN